MAALTLAIDSPHSGNTPTAFLIAPELQMVARDIDLLLRASIYFHALQELLAAADRARQRGVAAARSLARRIRTRRDAIADVRATRYRHLSICMRRLRAPCCIACCCTSVRLKRT